MAEKENVQLKKASEKLDKMNLTESERELYEARELGLYFQQIGLANAEEHGYQEGQLQERKKYVQKLLKKNMSDKEIMDLVEIDKKELEKLKQELKEK